MLTGLATFTGTIATIPVAMTAPGVAGAIGLSEALNIANEFADQALDLSEFNSSAPSWLKVTKAHTGAKITRFATGGTAAITGDATSSNIFCKWCKTRISSVKW